MALPSKPWLLPLLLFLNEDKLCPGRFLSRLWQDLPAMGLGFLYLQTITVRCPSRCLQTL
jgi:hypothetical protein